MITIWKYPLALTLAQTLTLPKEARILHVGEQAQRLTLWVQVDDLLPHEDRVFIIVGTGHEVPGQTPAYPLRHLGTVQMADGFVWHVFEETQP